ncbi:MAG: four helix bundle protein, partial [Bacteroidota bacterium]
MYEGYKELDVWKESMKLVVEIYRLTKNFPANEKFGLTSQMQRSAVSIPSNIAEGWSRNYDKVFIQFLNTAQGSAAELETQLILTAELKFTNDDSVSEILNLVIRIKKMIRSLI